RQTRSVPILAELKAWLDPTLPTVPPKTALGEALAYLHKYWSRLVRYTERGDLPIDNNVIHAASGMMGVMPTPGLCRHLPTSKGRNGWRPYRKLAARHNQKLPRKASNWS